MIEGVSALSKYHYTHTNHRCVEEVLRLTAFLLSIYDKEVDLSWMGDEAVSIRGDLNKKHVLEEQSKAVEKTSQVT